MGYAEINFILNSGTSFWLLVSWAFLGLISIILQFIPIFQTRWYNIAVKLNTFVFFQLIIRIFLETYLELLVCALINVTNLNWNFNGERLSSLFSCVMVVGLTAAPQMVHYLLTKNQRQILNNKSISERYGDMYEGLKPDDKFSLTYPYYFLMRRMSLAYILVIFKDVLFF